ncbi:MAG: CRISPR-associated endonuclease Cas2 [Candidatus Margulisiibacteriota bacterium]
MLTWLISDISEDKVRNKLVKECKKVGMYRVQKSVFLGDIENPDVKTIKQFADSIIDHETDSVYIFPMCEADFKRASYLGQAFNKDLVCDELKSLVL